MGRKLSQEEIKEIILDFENKYPVEGWRINSVDLWPYLRIKLYLFLLNLDNLKTADSHPFNKDKTGSSSKSGRGILEKLFSLPKSMFVYKTFIKNLKKKELIFFGAHFHRTLYDGVYFNRFFDPMIAAHKLHDEVYFIEYEKLFSNTYNSKAIIPLHKYLDHFKFWIKFWRTILPEKTSNVKSKLIDYEHFHKELLKDFPEAEALKIEQQDLKRWAAKIRLTKEFFLNLYKKVKPKKLLFLSYYGYDDLAAAIVAGHEMQIPVIDFQHGPQTNVHMAYSSWTKHPPRGYNTMPTEYWNWDLNSKKNLELWTKKTGQVQAKIAGHPFIAYCSREKEREEEEKRIFFSLQTLDLKEMIPPVILESVKNSNFKWVFRLHPRSNFSVEGLKEFFEFHNIDKKNYEIESAMDVPLPVSLTKAKLHITNFSGCVLEARMLGVPSIIIHESGRAMFENYIDDKLVSYLKLGDDIGGKINRLMLALSERHGQKREEVINPL